jgi:hypothetical protein
VVGGCANGELEQPGADQSVLALEVPDIPLALKDAGQGDLGPETPVLFTEQTQIAREVAVSANGSRVMTGRVGGRVITVSVGVRKNPALGGCGWWG